MEPSPLLRILWMLAWPIRCYVRRTPLRRGTGRLAGLLIHLLPKAPSGYVADLREGGTVELLYREAIGSSVLLYGSFEGAEIRHLLGYVEAGTVAIDVGANVGIFTIPLAKAVADGRVVAFEPHPGNVQRLTSNIARNKLSNVEVIQAAAGDFEGTIELRVAADPAFHSIATSETTEGEQGRLSIRQRRIDLVWNEFGQPVVSAIKIDVEGEEIRVLSGCEDLLATCSPALLIEAASEERLERLTAWLTRRGYAPSQPSGFAPWNFLFLRTAIPALVRG